MLVWYIESEIGINTSMNIDIKYQTNLVWRKCGTSLIPVLHGRDLR
jgi:hypothetical protein